MAEGVDTPPFITHINKGNGSSSYRDICLDPLALVEWHVGLTFGSASIVIKLGQLASAKAAYA